MANAGCCRHFRAILPICHDQEAAWEALGGRKTDHDCTSRRNTAGIPSESAVPSHANRIKNSEKSAVAAQNAMHFRVRIARPQTALSPIMMHINLDELKDSG